MPRRPTRSRGRPGANQSGAVAAAASGDKNSPMDRRDRQDDDDRFTASLAGLAWTLFLGLCGLYLVLELSRIGKLEDCVMQGRMNCTRIELPRGR
jgi:hypothetical protein